MTIRMEMNRSLTLVLAALLSASSGTLLQGQALMQAPLGDTTEPKMSLFVTTLPAGYTGPTHQHAGVVFIYVLEGEIESRVEPDPPRIYRAGDFFHERPGQVHRIFRNLSTTAPAKFVNFSNIATPNLHPQDPATRDSGAVAARLLLQESLTDLANQEVSVVKITTAPGSPPASAHQHTGPVFAYLVKGEVESQVEPGEPKVYRAGDVFYEPPMHTHRLYRNLSKTEVAELLVFQVSEKDKPRTVGAPPVAQTPPGMMPYVAILEPQFVPASEASFLQDDDTLIGIARGSVAKAFPAADLTQHGSVNDQMPDAPIEVTWCGVCNTGAVFRAQIKGRTLHFDYDSMVGGNEVHKDRETGSRWQQSTGEAISGPLKGSFLELYPFVRTTWKEWRRRYPNTLVLKPLPGYDERMPNVSKRIRAVTLSGEGDAPKGAFGRDDRLRPREVIAGLRVGAEEKAFPFSQLRIARVVNDRVGGVPVLIVHQPLSDTTTAFEARAKGKVLRFQVVDADASSVTDLETHSKWDAYGLCLEGPLKGTQLKTLILIPEFWFAWSEFHPKSKVFTASGANASTGAK